MFERRGRNVVVSIALCFLVIACVVQGPDAGARHRWWAGLGPVLPHDTFPADCSLCHLGQKWHELRADFSFDHEGKTGVKLEGAHAQAKCLRCHNDRGPVDVFQAKGCVGCHQDRHNGMLGANCTECHTQRSWRPFGQIALHSRTRFPLDGAHASTACHKCHPGALVGKFVPTDPECVTCHRDDVAQTTNPPHLALGWVDRCDRCHIPTTWNQARIK